MKNLKLQTLLLMLFVSSVMILGSCKKDSTSDPVDGDKTALNALIAESEALANAATTADYPQAAIDNFKATLQTIKTTSASVLTQAQITNLITSLTEAKKTFASQQYGFIDETLYLNAGWHFDEGTGTIATAFSTVKHVGTFAAGNAGVFGADALSPTWVTGVKGGKAVYLDKGAHLEVPYTNAFLPANISISVWIKPIELYENNYILSRNFWQGYKLQTQSGGKAFFTYRSGAPGSNLFVNQDGAETSIVVNQWNHIVVTVNSTTLEEKFYANGILTKTWTALEGGIVAFPQTLGQPDPQPFIIGCVATDAQLATWAWTETPTSLGYFKGAVDELKIYNTALDAGQVGKLYNDEKP